MVVIAAINYVMGSFSFLEQVALAFEGDSFAVVIVKD